MRLDDISRIIKEKGVAGAGGAGFPSYAKLNTKADTLILNCAECEPLLKLHRQLLEKYALEILTALDIVAKALGNIKETIICLKGSYKEAILAVESEIDNFNNMKIHKLDEFYPAGDEVVTIYEATKRVVPPGKIPISVGVIVFNVETVYNIYNAIKEDLPVTHKYVTITGEVEKPITLKVPIGTKVSELLKIAQVKNLEDNELIMGGPMTGSLVDKNAVVTKTTNAILVLPKNSIVINKRHSKTSIDMKRAMSSCCQCNMCTDLCPRNLLGMPIDPKEFMKSATTGVTKDIKPYINTLFCSSCGVCEMFACPQGLSPRTLIDIYKAGLRAHGVKAPEVKESGVKSARSYRRVAMSRLISRLGLVKYNVPAPLCFDEVKPPEVKIMLSQTIGAPATCIVKEGDNVNVGDIIAKVDDDSLGCNLHASISGKVIKVTEKYITVR